MCCLLTCLFGHLEYYLGRCADGCSFRLVTLSRSSVFIAPSGYCSRAGSLAFHSNSSLDTRVTALALSSFCLLRKLFVRWVNVMCQMMASCSVVPKLRCSCLFSTTLCFYVRLVGSYAQQHPWGILVHAMLEVHSLPFKKTAAASWGIAKTSLKFICCVSEELVHYLQLAGKVKLWRLNCWSNH